MSKPTSIPSITGAAFTLEALESRLLLSATSLPDLSSTPSESASTSVLALASVGHADILPAAEIGTPAASLFGAFTDSPQLTLVSATLKTYESKDTVVYGTSDLLSQITIGDGSSSAVKLSGQTSLIQADWVKINSPLVALNFVVNGDGTTTKLSNTISASTIIINDAIEVSGNFNQGPAIPVRSITSTAGYLTINGTINGDNHLGALAPVNQNSAVDDLVLNATGPIYIRDAVGGISGNGLRHVSVNIDGGTVSDVTFDSSVKLDGNLYIKKGQDITFNGSVTITGDLIIEEAGEVRFNGEVIVTGNLRIMKAGNVTFSSNVSVSGNITLGRPDDLTKISSVTFTSSSRLDFQGQGAIYTSGSILFGNNIGQSASLRPDSFTLAAGGGITFTSSAALLLDTSTPFVITQANGVLFANNITSGNITIGRGGLVSGNITFDGISNAVESLDITTTSSTGTVSIRSLTVNGGDATITANNIDFISTINSAGYASTLTLKPYDVTRAIVVGTSALGAPTIANRLDINGSDLLAIQPGFGAVVFGDLYAGTGTVYVGRVGVSQSITEHQFVNRTVIAGGAVIVTRNFDVSITVDYLRLVARTGDITVNGVINGGFDLSDVANETFPDRNAWVRLEAANDIIVNRAVYAATRISLSAGTDGVGNIIVNSTGTNSGSIQTVDTASGAQRVELISGSTSGDISLIDDIGATTIRAAGASSSVVLRSAAGAITQTNGLITADTLSVWASGNVSLRTDVNQIASQSLNGEVLSGGTGAAITAKMEGKVTSLFLTSGGSLYTVAPTVNISAPPAGGAQATATATIVGGFVTSLTIINQGAGYITAPTVSFTLGTGDTTGSGAGAYSLVTPGALLALTRDNGGTGFSAVPVITVMGDGRTVATAASTISGGVSGFLVNSSGSSYTSLGLSVSAGTAASTGNITNIPGQLTSASLDVIGSSYTVAPDVTVNGDGTGGTGAVVTASLNASLNALSRTSGSGYTYVPSIYVTGGAASQTINGLQITGSGSVNIVNSGAITIANATVTPNTASTRGSFTLSTLSGNISLGYINTSSGAISLTAAGAITDANSVGDGLPNLVTTGLVSLTAATGIGAIGGADIDITAGSLQVLNSTSGNIVVQHSGRTGLIIAGTGVTNQNSGGSIIVRSEALNSTAADLAVSAPVTATGAGDITLEACLLSSGAIGNTGTISLGATVSSGSGAITLNAGASINDATVSESALLVTTGQATLTAVTGIGSSAAGGDIDTTINTLQATNSTSGDIYIQETNTLEINGTGVRTLAGAGKINIDVTSGNLNVNAVVTSHTTGSTTLAAGADIALGATVTSPSGSLTLTAGAAVTDTTIDEAALLVTTGQTTLSAVTGIGSPVAGGDIDTTINTLQANNTTSGGIYIQETDTLIVNGTGVVNLAAGAHVNLDVAAGSLTVDAVVTASTTGAITLSAFTDIALGATVSSGSGSLTLTAGAAITDITAPGEAALLVTTGLAALDASSGIGNTGASDIDTSVGSLTAINRTSGNLVIEEADDITISAAGFVNNAAAAHIILSTLAGTITVSGPVTATGAGNIRLSAAGATSDIIGYTAISTGTNGNVTLLAARSLTLSTGASVAVLGTGTLDLEATAGSITFAANVVATTAGGNMRLLANNDVTLTGLNAGAGSVTVTADTGSIIDGGETSRDLVADTARLDAAVGIGDTGSAATPSLETTLGTVAAVASTGGIRLSELDTLTVGTVAALSVRRVLLDGTASGIVGDSAATSDVAATTGDVVLATGGALTLTEGTLTSTIKTAVSTTTGTISLTATTGDVIFQASAVSSSDGNINATATVGSLTDSTADEDSLIITSALATLNASTGVGTANAGDIDTTGGSIQSNVSTSGGVFIQETDTLIVASGGLVTQDGNAPISLVVTTGPVTVNGVITAHGSGNIHINAAGGAATYNSAVSSTSGHITLRASGDINLKANVTSGTTGTLNIVSGATIAQDDGFRVSTGSGDIRLVADTNVALASLSTTGNVSVTATNGSITDNGDTHVDIIASSARLRAGTFIATAANHLETTLATLSASTNSGGIFIIESDGLTVTTTNSTVQDVLVDTTALTTNSEGAQSDLTTGGNGNIVLDSTTGDLTLNDGSAPAGGTALSANGNGSILIYALAGNLIGNADIVSGSGQITLKADDDIQLNANVDVQTGAGGTISIDAAKGTLTMAGSANVTATGSSARLRAQGDITLGNVTAANVSMDSDNGALINAAGSTKNVTAENVRMQAKNGLGASGRHLTTNLDRLSALSETGSIYVTEDNEVTVNSVRVQVTDFNGDATTTVVTDAAQSDLTTSANGNIVLAALEGTVTLNDGDSSVTQTSGDSRQANGTAVSANGTGSILIAARGTTQTTAGNLIGNADIVSATGDITLQADDNIDLSSGVYVQTGNNGTTTIGTIDVLAVNGNFTMATDAVLRTTTGDIRVSVGNDSTDNAILGRLIAATGTTPLNAAANVSVAAAGSILDADSATDTITNITALGLRLAAGLGIGTGTNAIETMIASLSARATAPGVFVTESDTLVIGDVSSPRDATRSVTVETVESTGVASTQTEALQSDVRTTGGGGAIVIRVNSGNLTLTDGTATSDNTSVSADNSGNVLLETVSSSADIIAQADTTSGSGHITLLAGRAIDLQSTADVIVSSGTGTILIQGTSSSVTQADNSRVTAASGDIRLSAATSVTLGGVTTGGNVSIEAANGSISDAGDAFGGSDINAAGLRANATLAIGAPSAAIETSVSTVSARATSGGIYLTETDAVTVGTTSVTVQQVSVNGTTLTSVVAGAQSGLITTAGNGIIDLRSSGGTITFVADSSAHGSGAFSVATAGANSDIVFAAVGSSTTGTITLNSSARILETTSTELPVVSTSGVLSMTAVTGIGLTGRADFDVSAPSLNFTNTGTGLVYIKSQLAAATLTSANFSGTGSFIFTQLSGGLTIAGPVNVANGSGTFRVPGTLTLTNATVTTSRDLTLAAGLLALTGSSLASGSPLGTLKVVTSGNATFDAISTLSGTDIQINTGGNLSIGQVNATGLLDIQVVGNLSASSSTTSLVAGQLRLSITGDIGSTLTPIRVNAGVSDVNTTGSLNIVNLNSLTIGRGGLQVTTSPTETKVVAIQGTTVGSIGGSIVDNGTGILRVDASGPLSLATSVVSVGGSIVVNAGSLTDGTTDENALLIAQNGRVTINATSGVGSTGLVTSAGSLVNTGVAGIEVLASQVQATTQTGSLALVALGSTTIAGTGLTITGPAATGTLSLIATSGNITQAAPITQSGSGAIQVNAAAGTFSMTDGSILSTTVGTVNVYSRDLMTIYKINSTTGVITLRTLDSINTQGLLNYFNVSSLARPEISMVGYVRIYVDAAKVLGSGPSNTFEIVRGSSAYINMFQFSFALTGHPV